MRDYLALHQQLNPFLEGTPPSPEITAYLESYFKTLPGCEHQIGLLNVASYSLALQLFKPKIVERFILLVHGYYNHSLTNAALIRTLVENNSAVFCLDLPGHGLSSGTRGDIGSFTDYETSIATFLTEILPRYASSIHIVAHSTGTVGVTDYLMHHPDQTTIGMSFLVAPLIRLVEWERFKIVEGVVKHFVKHIERRFNDSSATPEFIAAMASDPLENHVTTIHWLNEFIRWETQTRHYGVDEDSNVIIMQGMKDTTIEIAYTLDWYRKHFENCQMFEYPAGTHHLFNDQTIIFSQLVRDFLSLTKH